MSTRRLGMLAEDAAAAFLEMKGLAVIARNYTFHRHEIDIVAALDERVIFVEVKCRSGDRHGSPKEAVRAEKMRRIVSAARGFLAERGLADRPVRFDVIEVRLERGGLSATIEHVVGAFGADLRGW
jgi:putative endonuclease